MVRIGKDHVATIVSEIKQLKMAASMNTDSIDKAADKVLNQ